MKAPSTEEAWPSSTLRLWNGEQFVSPTYHQHEGFRRALELLDDTRTPGARSAAQQLDDFLAAVWQHSTKSSELGATPRRAQRRLMLVSERAARARERIHELRRVMRKDSSALALLDGLLESPTCRPVIVIGRHRSDFLASFFLQRPHLVGYRGGAGERSDPNGIWRGACIAALDELLPDGLASRYSTIASLLSVCGMPCDRHQARGVIESRNRRRKPRGF